MKSGQIIRLVPLNPAWISASNDDATFPATSLADPQPKVVYRVPATGVAPASYALQVDLQADTAIDTVALLFSTGPAAVTWSVAATTGAQGSGAALTGGGNIVAAAQALPASATTLTSRFHAVASFASTARRYVRVVLTAPAGTPAFTIGLLSIGQTVAIDPVLESNFDLGSGRRIDDLSDVTQLPGGEFGIWRKARVPVFRATWSGLKDAELRSLWALLDEVGTSAPLLLIEDPDATTGLQERIHYGLLDGLDFYSRSQVDKSSIELRVRRWL